jgi:hypothetical protein
MAWDFMVAGCIKKAIFSLEEIYHQSGRGFSKNLKLSIKIGLKNLAE